jgi:hypothetical protein
MILNPARGMNNGLRGQEMPDFYASISCFFVAWQWQLNIFF